MSDSWQRVLETPEFIPYALIDLCNRILVKHYVKVLSKHHELEEAVDELILLIKKRKFQSLKSLEYNNEEKAFVVNFYK